MSGMVLSPSKRLKDLRLAREFIRKAEELHNSASYGPLYASLDSDEQALVAQIKAIQAAFDAPLALRLDFYSDLGSVRLVVRPPGEEGDYPYITQSTYDALKKCLHTDDVRVDSPYDVAVVIHGVIQRIINGRNSR